jgi:hypothetical protein
MNGFLWTAVAFALAGLLAIIASTFWGRTANPNDFGPVVVGLGLLALSEAIAVVLGVIGFVVLAI